MDKFLAKKNPIFKQIIEPGQDKNPRSSVAQKSQNQTAAKPQTQVEKIDLVFAGFGFGQSDARIRYRLNSAILQLTLKSMYESVRMGSWCLSAYQQLQADLYFLFSVCFEVGQATSAFDFLP